MSGSGGGGRVAAGDAAAEALAAPEPTEGLVWTPWEGRGSGRGSWDNGDPTEGEGEGAG